MTGEEIIQQAAAAGVRLKDLCNGYLFSAQGTWCNVILSVDQNGDKVTFRAARKCRRWRNIYKGKNLALALDAISAYHESDHHKERRLRDLMQETGLAREKCAEIIAGAGL